MHFRRRLRNASSMPHGPCDTEAVNSPLSVKELVGEYVRLEPLGEAHVDDLVAGAQEDRAAYRFIVVSQGREAMLDDIRGLLADFAIGDVVPFAQISVATGRAVGMTRFMNIRRRPGLETPYAVEIGGTWLSASAQRSGINTEAKLLLLAHAFEVWGVGRVDVKTDVRNQRSRVAIEHLGATFEGVLRHWQPSVVPGEGKVLRDTAMYSILDVEWPKVRGELKSRLF
jgi:RimJ/RimL family protein N-acetyltransferase